MTFYVTNQSFVVLTLFLVGVCSGLVYDVFTVKRLLLKTPNVLLFIEDIVFCLVSCIIFVFAIFITNYGYVRWYEAAFFAAGFVLYKLFVSWLVVKVFEVILKFTARIVKKAVQIVMAPLKFIWINVFRACKKLYRKLCKAAENNTLKRYSKKRMNEEIRKAIKGFEE